MIRLRHAIAKASSEGKPDYIGSAIASAKRLAVRCSAKKRDDASARRLCSS